MDRKLPFVGRIFWKVLAVVVVSVIVAWALVVWIIDYKITEADYGGSTICTVLLAYLIHLWLLPHEDLSRSEGTSADDDASSGDEPPSEDESQPS